MKEEKTLYPLASELYGNEYVWWKRWQGWTSIDSKGQTKLHCKYLRSRKVRMVQGWMKEKGDKSDVEST